jgi:hypothetical protein
MRTPNEFKRELDEMQRQLQPLGHKIRRNEALLARSWPAMVCAYYRRRLREAILTLCIGGP